MCRPVRCWFVEALPASLAALVTERASGHSRPPPPRFRIPLRCLSSSRPRSHTKNAQGGAFIESDDIGLIVGATVGGSLGLLGIVGGGVWVARTRRTPPMAENSDDSVMKLNSRSAQAHDPSVGDEAARSGEYEKHTPVSE